MNGVHGMGMARSSFKRVAGIALLWALPALLAASVSIPANDPLLRYRGRFDLSTPTAPRFDWPGVAIEAQFNGTSVGVSLAETWAGFNFYDAYVDNNAPVRVSTTASAMTSYPVASGLSAGSHHLLLVKRTEGFSGVNFGDPSGNAPSTFGGLVVDNGASLTALPTAPAHKVLFIGDSISVGYGVESSSTTCPGPAYDHPYTDNYAAFTALTGRRFDADYQVSAISGHGLVRNYGDTSAASAWPMPLLYHRTLSSQASPVWNDSAWQPDVVVVYLGTNDFSTSPAPSQGAYESAYQALISDLRGSFPSSNPYIFCAYASYPATYGTYVQDVVAYENGLGDAKVLAINLGNLSGTTGCDFHPGVAGQQALADTVSAALGAATGWATVTPTPSPTAVSTPVSLPRTFSDDMVLQRDTPIHVWGWAGPGDPVIVQFNGASLTAMADPWGRWSLYLPTMSANATGQPLTVQGLGNTLTLANVVLGDVWFCSGQSNMEYPIEMWPLEPTSPTAAADVAAANYPGLRLFRANKDVKAAPQEDLSAGVRWKVCTPANVPGFSRLAYFFGRYLTVSKGVPVGLIESAYGGTAAEPFISLQALQAEPGLAAAVPTGSPSSSTDNTWPTGVYNAMIAPLVPFTVKGFLWDQGESNTSIPPALVQPTAYGLLQTTLINDWRSRFDQALQAPFLLVQLQGMAVIDPSTGSSYSWASPLTALDSGWSQVRWGQFQALQLPNVGVSVNIDLNPNALTSTAALSYHPPDKLDYAMRLTPWAEALAYGNNVPHSGPLYLSYSVETSAVRVYFSNVSTFAGASLVTTDGLAPHGFQIAPASGAFTWATASFSGSTVLVSNPAVPVPAKVRYAWSYDPLDPLGASLSYSQVANLGNAAGFWASPFQTEDRPRARVYGNGLAIEDQDLSPSLSDGTDMGAMDISQVVTVSFTLKNEGSATLTLDGVPLVSPSGPNAADFSVVQQPTSASLAPGASETFLVRFQPGGIGLRSAVLRMANSDSSHSPYSFAMQGRGTSIYSATPTPAVVITPTATPTPAPTSCVPEDYTFESGLDGFSVINGSGGNLRSDPAQSHDGTHALAVDITLTSASNQVLLQRTAGFPASLSGNTMHFWVWVPAGMSDASNPSGVLLFIQTGGGWAWNQSSWANLPSAGGWTEVTWDLSAIPAMSSADNFGIKIALGGSSPNWSGTVYVDSAGRKGLSCSSPTPSPVYSPTPSATVSPSFTASPALSPTPTSTPSPVSSPTATPSCSPSPTLTAGPASAPGHIVEAVPLGDPQSGGALKLAFKGDGPIDAIELSLYSSAYHLILRSRIEGPFAAGWQRCARALSEPLAAGIYFYRLQGVNQGHRAGKPVAGRLYRLP